MWLSDCERKKKKRKDFNGTKWKYHKYGTMDWYTVCNESEEKNITDSNFHFEANNTH